jgi:hypothetical protein
MQPNNEPKRELIESLVKSLDTGTLVQMLAAQGINIGQPTDQESPFWSSEGDQNPQGWNNIKVELEGGEKRGPIHSVEKYLNVKNKMEESPEYLAAEEQPGMEPWMQGGGVQG